MRKITIPLLIVLSLIIVQCSSTKNTTLISTEAPIVENVILLIGDGMGVSQVYSGITANNGLNLE